MDPVAGGQREGRIVGVDQDPVHERASTRCWRRPVPRGVIGNDYGDIGFELTESGEYRPVMDELDRSRALEGRFIPKLRAAYNERVIAKVAARLRGTIHRAVEGGVVKIKVRF